MLFTIKPSCALAETSSILQVLCIASLGCLANLPVIYVPSIGCLEKRTSTVRAVYWLLRQFIPVVPPGKLKYDKSSQNNNLSCYCQPHFSA